MKITVEIDLDDLQLAGADLRRLASMVDPGELLPPPVTVQGGLSGMPEHTGTGRIASEVPPNPHQATLAAVPTTLPHESVVTAAPAAPPAAPAEDWPADQDARNAIYVDLARRLGPDLNKAADLIKAAGGSKLRELDDRTQHAVYLQLRELVASHGG